MSSLISETIRKVDQQIQDTPCPHCGKKAWRAGGYAVGGNKTRMVCLGCQKVTEFVVTLEVKDDKAQ